MDEEYKNEKFETFKIKSNYVIVMAIFKIKLEATKLIEL